MVFKNVKGIIVLLILSCSLKEATAQDLNVGDKLPEIGMQTVMRYKKPQISLNEEFKGKPIIIDFWFTSCGACVASMPKLDSLQKRFGERVNIILSTFEKKGDIAQFFEQTKRVQNLSLPSFVSDSLLRKHFRHQSDPHEIWINKDGIVVAITEEKYVTEKNIEAFITEGKIDLPVKKDNTDEGLFLGTRPLFITDYNYNGGAKTNQYSFFGGYIKELGGFRAHLWVQNDGPYKGCIRSRFGNRPFLELYVEAYQNHFFKNQIIDKDSILKKYEPDLYQFHNLFCYDFISRDTSRVKALKKIQRGLDEYFEIESNVTVQGVVCYKLSFNGDINLLKTKHEKGHDLYNENDLSVFVNVAWNVVFEIVNDSNNKPMEILDETGIDKDLMIDISIPKDWSNIDKVNKHLSKYGLSGSIVTRERKVLTLNEFK